MANPTTPRSGPGARPDPADDLDWLVRASAQLGPTDEVVASVRDSLRRRMAIMPRFGHPLDTDEGQVKVSDLALKRLLANSIRQQTGRAVRSVEVSASDGKPTRLRVNLCARYGDELDQLAGQVRRVAEVTMTGALGAGRAASAAGVLELHWVDIESER